MKFENKGKFLPFCLSCLLCLFSLAGCGVGNSVTPPVSTIESAETSYPKIPAAGDKSVQSPDNSKYTSSAVQSAPEDNDILDVLLPNLRDDAYFEKTSFIGDSIMEGIRQYVAAERKNRTTLGEAKFLTSIMGITLADLVGDNNPCMYYSYGGKEAPLEELLADLDINRVFLLLGLNDLSATTAATEEVVERYARLITNLKESFSEIEVIVITTPPKTASSWLPAYVTNRSFGNERIGEFVAALIAMCDENGVPYIDAYGALKDEAGALPDDFCRDGYIHLNNAGSEVVVDTLYAFVSSQN